jgi:TPR repeat protein
MMQTCCSKWICDGCAFANKLREREARLQNTCPFCRNILPTTQEEAEIINMKRAEKSDPVAMTEIGKKHCEEKDYERAIEYWTKAADLGDVEAHFDLAFMNWKGKGVEKDEKRGLYHLVEAAIAGHPGARYNLALKEGRSERFDRAVKHFIIAANLGHGGSIQMLKEFYADGLVSKEDFAAALRAHQAAVDATKSPQRDAASEFYAAHKERRE